MPRDPDTLPSVKPSATPSDDDIRDWESLPRDEQMRRLRKALQHPDCAVESNQAMGDILKHARARG